MLLADFGTSYCKLLDTDVGVPSVIRTKDIDRTLRVDLATGHNAKRFAVESINELTALARGGRLRHSLRPS